MPVPPWFAPNVTGRLERFLLWAGYRYAKRVGRTHPLAHARGMLLREPLDGPLSEHDRFQLFFYGAMMVSMLVVALPFIALFLFAFVALLAWPAYFQMAIPHIRESLQSSAFRAALVAGLTLVALALFVVREFLQTVYGAMESAIGAFTCWAALSRTDGDDFVMTWAAAGGVYIMVRGFVNISEARKKRRDIWSLLPSSDGAKASSAEPGSTVAGETR